MRPRFLHDRRLPLLPGATTDSHMDINMDIPSPPGICQHPQTTNNTTNNTTSTSTSTTARP